ncbi:hypothetical protein [Paenibacillus xylanexedens]|uniref:hypothetical protein n=1 Tax=Paenibacillus xylanexedens TaxID=528191 RepID=UPI0016435DD7|nr:hypothetical protein [Paenibacillus xylanexedens]
MKEVEMEVGKKVLVGRSESMLVREEGEVVGKRGEEMVDMMEEVEWGFEWMEERIRGDV